MSHAESIQSTTTKLPFWQQLRWNLILYFVILAIVPVIIVQAITLTLTTQHARAEVTGQLSSITELKTNQIQRWLQEVRTSTDLILTDQSRYEKFTNFLAKPLAGPGVEINLYLRAAANGILNAGPSQIK